MKIGTYSGSQFEITKSKSGGLGILMRNGYRYARHKYRAKVGHTVWRCCNRNVCNSLLTTDSTTVIKEEPHKCQQDTFKNEVKLKINECIRRAEDEDTPISTIYAEVFQQYNTASPEVIDMIPKYVNFKRTLHKHRNKKNETQKS